MESILNEFYLAISKEMHGSAYEKISETFLIETPVNFGGISEAMLGKLLKNFSNKYMEIFFIIPWKFF